MGTNPLLAYRAGRRANRENARRARGPKNRTSSLCVRKLNGLPGGVAYPSGCISARGKPIPGKNPFSTFEPVCGPKHFRNLQQTIDCMKNKTRPAPGNRLLRLALSSLAGYAFTCSPQALGAVTNVSIVNFAFSPANVTIRVNDSVTWRWVGSPHSTTSDPGLWESGVLGAGSTFTRTFTSPGNFPYHCSVHPFMTGAIAVQAANVSPTVALTNPADGSVFKLGPISLAGVATGPSRTSSSSKGLSRWQTWGKCPSQRP